MNLTDVDLARLREQVLDTKTCVSDEEKALLLNQQKRGSLIRAAIDEAHRQLTDMNVVPQKKISMAQRLRNRDTTKNRLKEYLK